MAWYDLNNNVDSVAYGSLIARLWGFFIGGSFVGVWVGFAERWSVVLDYEGHYFRGDSNAHYASLRIGLDL